MKKLAYSVGLAAAAFSTAAAAQAQIYGVLDTGVEHLTNTAAGRSLTRVPTLTGGMLPSRIGFRISEDLGGGLRAVANLESGIAVDSGEFLQGGRLFGRASTVGLAGPWGSVTLGRQPPAAYYSFFGADVIGPAAFSLYSLDIYPAIAWVDNSVSYRGTFSGVTVGATYSLGRDGAAPANCAGESATSSSACKAWSALLRWDQPGGAWGVSAGYDVQKGGGTGGFIVILGQPLLSAPRPEDTDTRRLLTGYAMVGPVKVGGGWVGRDVKNATRTIESDLYFLGVSYPVTAAVTIDGQVSAIRNKDLNADATQTVVRASYAFSKRTAVYALAGRMHNRTAGANYSVSVTSSAPASPASGKDQTGYMVGIRHSF